MLTKIRLRNFKAFKDTGDIEIAPLTVLTGPNSSGKSAIIRAMMALRQTTENRDPNTAFVPVGDYVDLGRYEDFVFKHDTKSAVGFDVGLRLSSPLKIYESGMPSAQDPSGMSISLDLSCIPSTGRIYLAQSTVRLGQGLVEVVKATKRGSQTGKAYRTRVDWLNELTVNLRDSNTAKFHTSPPFQMKDPSTGTGNSRKGKGLLAAQLANVVENSVLNEFGQLFYIGQLRERPKRMYLSTGEALREVGAAGELGPAVLWDSSKNKQLNLEQRLSDWFSRMGLASEIDLVAAHGGFFQVLFIDALTQQKLNLPDAGGGASQMLPVLVQGLIAPPGSTLILEQPEIYLDPKVQAGLADFLIEVSHRGVGVIVETHSEHIVTRLQRRIAEEALKPERIALYYVTPSPEGSKVERVEVNEYGQIPGAPKAFFEHGFEETFDLVRAIGERKRQERPVEDDD